MATGTYITRADLDRRWGRRNIDSWSSLDDDQSGADDAVLQSVIDVAEQAVEDAFRNSRYAVPLTAESGTLHQVVHWCATLAGVDLFGRRTGRKPESLELMAAARAVVMEEIAEAISGVRSLNAARSENDGDSPAVLHSRL